MHIAGALNIQRRDCQVAVDADIVINDNCARTRDDGQCTIADGIVVKNFVQCNCTVVRRQHGVVDQGDRHLIDSDCRARIGCFDVCAQADRAGCCVVEVDGPGRRNFGIQACKIAVGHGDGAAESRSQCGIQCERSSIDIDIAGNIDGGIKFDIGSDRYGAADRQGANVDGGLGAAEEDVGGDLNVQLGQGKTAVDADIVIDQHETTAGNECQLTVAENAIIENFIKNNGTGLGREGNVVLQGHRRDGNNDRGTRTRCGNVAVECDRRGGDGIEGSTNTACIVAPNVFTHRVGSIAIGVEIVERCLASRSVVERGPGIVAAAVNHRIDTGIVLAGNSIQAVAPHIVADGVAVIVGIVVVKIDVDSADGASGDAVVRATVDECIAGGMVVVCDFVPDVFVVVVAAR